MALAAPNILKDQNEAKTQKVLDEHMQLWT